MKGRIEFPAAELEDMVILRSDGRPVYNFASPVDDWADAITHVIRGDDHVSNTPKQIVVLAALGAELPVYAHVPNVFGEDGRKLSKRHGAVAIDEFREAGYIAPALMNFLALLGWAPDGETTIMSEAELVERFTLERVGVSPATFDYAKLDWMNGVYLRDLAPDAYADALVGFLRERGIDWDEARVRAAAPLVQEKIGRLGEFPGFAGFLFGDVEPDPAQLDRGILEAAATALGAVAEWSAASIEAALKALCDELGQKPRQVFGPIRVAVTGSRISPGLYESLELLGRDVSLARLRARRGARRVSGALVPDAFEERAGGVPSRALRGVARGAGGGEGDLRAGGDRGPLRRPVHARAARGARRRRGGGRGRRPRAAVPAAQDL